MQTSEQLEHEVKKLIIELLALEDVTPADIEPEAALFVEFLRWKEQHRGAP